MRKISVNLFLLLTLVAANIFSQENKRPVLQDIDYTAVLEQKMKVEEKYERYVNQTLEKMLGPDVAEVKVDITPNVEKSRVETESWAKQASQTGAGGLTTQPPQVKEFLPGIPMKQSLVQKQEQQKPSGQMSGVKRNIESVIKIPESFIKKMDATLIISQAVPDDEFVAVKKLVVNILGIDPKRGDRLTVERVKFSLWKRLLPYLTNPYFYLTLLAALVTFLFFAFLFGPLKKFLFSLLATMKELKEMKSEVEASGAGGGGGGVGVAEGEIGELEGGKKEGEEETLPAEIEESPEEIEKRRLELIATLPVPEEEVGKMAFKPFKFVEDKDLKKIAYLLSNEDPKVAATVMHYLDDEKAAKLMKMFPEDKKGDIVLALTRVQLVEQRKIAALERVLKRRIDLTSGGVDRLMDILSLMDDKSRDEILNYISSTNPEMAEKVRGLVFSFENLASLDDITLQTILAEINAPDLAVALKGLDSELRERILNNLSEAARRLVEEEEESGRAAQATEAQIANQRRDIIAKIRSLETEGRIDLGGLKEISIMPDEISTLSGRSIMEEVDEEIEREEKREEERKKRREKIGMVEEEAPVVDNEKAFEYYSRGNDFYQEGNYEEAASQFQESVKYNPDIWQSWQFLGSSLFALGREEEAIKAYEKSLEINPENEELKKWLEEHKPKEEESQTDEESGESESETESSETQPQETKGE
ncbi:MAG: tetratricopeptide repeat protein [Elusimicrobia bacterium]|nr:tetratricopeptide repeat protein [Elusimicrobiota bacterium]